MGTGGDGGGVSSVERPEAMSEYARVVLDPTPKSRVYKVTNPASRAEVSLLSVPGWTPRPKGALRWAEEENRDEWARRVIASIPAPMHITAATLRARQPREADRAPIPLP